MCPALKRPLACLVAPLFFFACSAEDEKATPVTLQVEHQVNGAALQGYVLDTPFTNAFGNKFGVTRLVYFLSDVTLNPSGGSPVAAAGAHYVDHEQAASRTFEFELPAGTDGLATISFVMGLPPALNVTGAFTSPPESLMEWPVGMGGGYHHMKFEGKYVDASDNPVPFKVHSGPLEGVDYSMPVSLDASSVFLSGSAVTLKLVMNLDEWMTGPNTWDLNQQFQPPVYGMMDSPAKQLSLQQNCAGVFSLEAP